MDDYELAHEYETVNVYRRGGAAKIELNRPETRNAWNKQFAADAADAIRAAGDDPAVRAVVFTGAGRGFSSGADLKGLCTLAGRNAFVRELEARRRAPAVTSDDFARALDEFLARRAWTRERRPIGFQRPAS